MGPRWAAEAPVMGTVALIRALSLLWAMDILSIQASYKLESVEEDTSVLLLSSLHGDALRRLRGPTGCENHLL